MQPAHPFSTAAGGRSQLPTCVNHCDVYRPNLSRLFLLIPGGWAACGSHRQRDARWVQHGQLVWVAELSESCNMVHRLLCSVLPHCEKPQQGATVTRCRVCISLKVGAILRAPEQRRRIGG
jgi:hypothetical protein